MALRYNPATMTEPKTPLHLTSRFTQAIEYARITHVNSRKATAVPYMAHLLGVASLVMGENGHVPFPVTEDIAIAALLHDAVEDAGGMPRLNDIEANFGSDVARMVLGCSDSTTEDASQKSEWKERKAAYIRRLPKERPDTLLVSMADKLYNARSMAEDYKQERENLWKRFKRGRDDQLWYFDELIRVYQRRCKKWRMLGELKRIVEKIETASEPKSS